MGYYANLSREYLALIRTPSPRVLLGDGEGWNRLVAGKERAPALLDQRVARAPPEVLERLTVAEGI